MNMLFSGILGYLFGSIPFALVIGKVFYKTDIRKLGSGNLGGSNAGRTLGAKAGIVVIVLDALKGFIAMSIVSLFYQDAIIYAGFFATLGHCFPLFANFKGGKAVATSIGFLLGISTFMTHNFIMHLLVPIAVFLVVLYISKMVSLASMVTLIITTFILNMTQPNHVITLTFALITGIVIYRHKDNIVRIQNKTERKITWM